MEGERGAIGKNRGRVGNGIGEEGEEIDKREEVKRVGVAKKEDKKGKLSRKGRITGGSYHEKGKLRGVSYRGERLRGLSYRGKGEKGEAIGERVKKGRRKRELMAKRIYSTGLLYWEPFLGD